MQEHKIDINTEKPINTEQCQSRKSKTSSRKSGAAAKAFEVRRAACLQKLEDVKQLLEQPTEDLPLQLQQVVHEGCGCQCNPDLPICGERYHCVKCKEHFCKNCYQDHPTNHKLILYREALPEHTPTATTQWAVREVVGHRTVDDVVEYEIRWYGPWSNSFHTREELNNDNIIETYTKSLSGKKRRRPLLQQ